MQQRDETALKVYSAFAAVVGLASIVTSIAGPSSRLAVLMSTVLVQFK